MFDSPNNYRPASETRQVSGAATWLIYFVVPLSLILFGIGTCIILFKQSTPITAVTPTPAATQVVQAKQSNATEGQWQGHHHHHHHGQWHHHHGNGYSSGGQDANDASIAQTSGHGRSASTSQSPSTGDITTMLSN